MKYATALLEVAILAGVVVVGTAPTLAADLQSTQLKLLASDAAKDDHFGGSVAVDGDTAAVGAYLEGSSGSVYVFRRGAEESAGWEQGKKLKESELSANGRFGLAVSLSGTTLVVGTLSATADIGVAYVYERDAGGADNWGKVKKLMASDGEVGDGFGMHVFVDGDTIVVGAPGSGGSDFNAAYVFERDAGGAGAWGEVRKLTPSESELSFGSDVCVSGDTALVLATSGAYLFGRDEGGPDHWGELTKLTPSTVVGASSIALDGDRAVLAHENADYDGIGSGVAFVFARDQGGPGNWGEVQLIGPGDGAENDDFGRCVVMSGNRILVGAPYDDDNESKSGSAYLFEGDPCGTTWTEVGKLTASDGDAGDRFGSSVSLDGDTALVGAPFDSEPGALWAGSSYAIELSGLGVPSTEVVRLGSPANPHAFLPGVTTGPLTGVTWDPVIDHSTFQPGALFDIVLVSTAPANLPLPEMGTLLCDLTAPYFVFTSAPGQPFAIPVPPNCNLVGFGLAAQGVSTDGVTHAFTNALDVTVGSF